MKTIIVVSDSHGNRTALDALNRIFAESDYIIHLGDTSSDGSYIREKFPTKTHVINGNCEFMSVGVKEEIITIEGINILACHGHAYSVKSTLAPLAMRAKELGCQIALYGHTHEAREDCLSGVALLNPGTLSKYSHKSYLYLVVNGDKFTSKIVRIE